MAGERQLAAAAEGKAVDRGDHRLAGELELAEHSLTAPADLDPVYRAHLRQLADVCAGNECLLADAGQDHTAYRLVAGDLLHRFAKFPDDLRVERVELVGAVDRDRGDPSLQVELESRIVGHGVSNDACERNRWTEGKLA